MNEREEYRIFDNHTHTHSQLKQDPVICAYHLITTQSINLQLGGTTELTGLKYDYRLQEPPLFKNDSFTD